jgi:hypothetical protein
MPVFELQIRGELENVSEMTLEYEHDFVLNLVCGNCGEAKPNKQVVQVLL